MRPARSLILGLSAIAILAVVAASIGSRSRPTSAADTRPSTLITEPNGAKALAEALERLGSRVERLRRFELRPLSADSGTRSLLVLLDPPLPLSGSQTLDVMDAVTRGVSVIAVGRGSRTVLRCYGFDVKSAADSVAVDGIGAVAPRVDATLRPTNLATIVDSSGLFDATITSCDVPAVDRVDTLAMAGDRLVAITLRPRGTRASVTLVSDASLFRNRTLRDTDAGPLVLPWMAGYPRIWFDEFHQGFVGGGSLAAFTLRWSRESPWGWLAWHAVIVGLLALAAGAIRFGPAIPAFDRRRRSVAEHVRALALALRAAGGHGAAIGLLVSGLRRRLTPGGRTGGATWRAWLDQLIERTNNPRAVAIGDRLRQYDRGKPSEREVLSAANLVEDLWSEMGS